MNQARATHRQLPPLLLPSKAHPFLSSSLLGVNISLTAIISVATAGGTRADNSPRACILRIRQAISRLLEINPGELLFLWPPKLHFHYLLRNAGQMSAIVSFTQTSIRATARVNGQWARWLWLIIWGFINYTLAGGQVASKKNDDKFKKWHWVRAPRIKWKLLFSFLKWCWASSSSQNSL